MNLTGYHVHFYCRLEQMNLAQSIRDALLKEVSAIEGAGSVRNRPVGPHTLPMFEAWFQPDALSEVIPWILQHRKNLSVLLHPITGDDYIDHTEHAMWIGEKVPLNLEVLR